MAVKAEGIDAALKEIDAAVAEVGKVSQAAFWEIGLKLIRLAMHATRPSVVLGNLRASAYVRPPQGKATRPDSKKLDPELNEPIPGDDFGDVGIELGFTAVYARNVHENLNSRSPKFLENPVVRNTAQVTQILKRRTGGE